MGDAAFEALWKNLLDHWDDDRVHDGFLELSAHRATPEAAARYRGMKGDSNRDRFAIAEAPGSGRDPGSC